MSMKTLLTEALNSSSAECSRIRKLILEVNSSTELTFTGKKNYIEKYQAELARFISGKQEEVKKAVETKIASMDAYYSTILKERNSNANYQTLLASQVQLLPSMIGNVSAEELKERLSMFEDDPFAISALKAAVQSVPRGTGSQINYLSMLDILPRDTRAEKKETLTKLAETVNNLLEEMNVKAAPAYSRNTNADTYAMVSGPSPIGSTLDYIDACNDDCTVYDRDKHFAKFRPTQDGENMSMAFNFNRLR